MERNQQGWLTNRMVQESISKYGQIYIWNKNATNRMDFGCALHVCASVPERRRRWVKNWEFLTFYFNSFFKSWNFFIRFIRFCWFPPLGAVAGSFLAARLKSSFSFHIIWHCVTLCDIIWHQVTLCDMMCYYMKLCDTAVLSILLHNKHKFSGEPLKVQRWALWASFLYRWVLKRWTTPPWVPSERQGRRQASLVMRRETEDREGGRGGVWYSYQTLAPVCIAILWSGQLGRFLGVFENTERGHRTRVFVM